MEDVTKDKRNIYLVTDTHFGHEKLSDVFHVRPVGFTDTILKNLKLYVHPYDTVIHLGDFCIRRDAEWMEQFMQAVSGANTILIRGNHDKKSDGWYMEHGFGFVCSALELRMQGKVVRLAHKPEEKVFGVDFQIHGHTHGKARRDDEYCSFYDPSYHKEFALENTNFTPRLLQSFF